MSLSLRLRCDICGKHSDSVICEDLAPRGAIKAAKVAPKWRRMVLDGARDKRDVCPECVAGVERFRAQADAVRGAQAR